MYITTDPKGFNYKAYLYEDIGPLEDYIDLIDLLNSASSEDTVYIYINTGGGYLDTTISIVEAIRQSQADVVTVAEGRVQSAGSIIFFSAHMHVIKDFCEIMLHDASGGFGGKFNEVEGGFAAKRKVLSELYNTVYTPYFTKKEIKKILEGKDLHLSATDIRERMDKVFGEEEEEKKDD